MTQINSKDHDNFSVSEERSRIGRLTHPILLSVGAVLCGALALFSYRYLLRIGPRSPAILR